MVKPINPQLEEDLEYFHNYEKAEHEWMANLNEFDMIRLLAGKIYPSVNPETFEVTTAEYTVSKEECNIRIQRIIEEQRRLHNGK